MKTSAWRVCCMARLPPEHLFRGNVPTWRNAGGPRRGRQLTHPCSGRPPAADRQGRSPLCAADGDDDVNLNDDGSAEREPRKRTGAELVEQDPRLAEVVRLVAAYEPLRIYLFGPAAPTFAPSSSSAPARSSSARRASSTIPAPRPARPSARRATASSSSTRTRPPS